LTQKVWNHKDDLAMFSRITLAQAFRLALCTLFALASVSTVSAGTIATWSGGGNGNWSQNGNWLNPANKPTTSGTYSLVFSGTPTRTTSDNNVGLVNIDSILFGNDGSASQSSAFTIKSTTPYGLTLINGATVTTTAISGTAITDTISLPLALSGTTTFNTGTNHKLVLSGSITGGGTIVKQGADILSISSAATISGGLGGLTIGAGELQLGGTDKVSSLDGLTVKIGGSSAGSLNLDFGNVLSYSGTSSVNFQMGNDAIVRMTNSDGNNFRFTAADFNVANANVTTAKTLSLRGGGAGHLQTVTVDGVIRDNSINGIVNVAFTGNNDFVLNGSSTYTGTTAISTVVLINGTLASPTVTVNTAGYLGGSGQLSGLVTVLTGGTFTPGGTSTGSTLTDSIARLTVGGLNLNSGATTNLAVTGTTAGSLFDQVSFTGGSPSLTYGGLLNLTLSGSYANQTSFGLFSGFTSPTTGDLSSIVLSATGSPYAGLTFQSFNLMAPSAEKTFLQSYFNLQAGDWISTWNTDNQRLIFSQSTGTLTVVPEPSTIVFAGIGIAMFGWSTWTRRRAKARRQAIEAALV